MRIALAGTRGPGFYGGFETCVAELSPRLAAMGHEVHVYARRWSQAREWSHPDVDVIVLPSVPTKNLDTVTHTALCTAHLLVRRPDVVIFFGVGNSPFAWLSRKAGIPTVLNVDGLDRTRRKWGRFARWYLTRTERLSPRSTDVLITDAHIIRRYYSENYGADSVYIPYGAPDGPVAETGEVRRWGLEPGRYLLYVSRLEPENNAHVLLDAYRRAGDVDMPLVIVGGAAYESDYEAELRARAPDGVVFTGFVFGEGYRQLQSHAGLYVQCTEVGGTHPALVEAMGFANAIVALDTPEHREVLDDAGLYYRSEEELAEYLSVLAGDAERRRSLAEQARSRAVTQYAWDVVAQAYADACDTAIGRP